MWFVVNVSQLYAMTLEGPVFLETSLSHCQIFSLKKLAINSKNRAKAFQTSFALELVIYRQKTISMTLTYYSILPTFAFFLNIY